MAADNRSIVITLKLDGSGTDNNDTTNQTLGAKVKSATDKGATAKAVAAFAVKQLIEIGVSETIAWGEYYWSRDLSLKDDYVAQRDKQIAMTQISRGFSAASSITSAAISGFTIGGPVGAIVGGAIGFITQAFSIARSNIQGQQNQEIQIRQMNAQLDFTRSRAGWSTQAASIGEDL